jgi:glycosyltransferase involved in cell wall biosynthesis
LLTDLLRRTYRLLKERYPKRTLGIYSNGQAKPQGRVLVSYLATPVPLKQGSRHSLGHSNFRECAEIVLIFNRLGYVVDLVAWDDATFIPLKEYDAVFDIHRNLQRYAPVQARKIFHVTGSNPPFSNAAEMERIRNLEKRRGARLMPRRGVAPADLDTFEDNLALADTVTLIGNQVTAATFPESARQKLQLVPATGSFLPRMRAPEDFHDCKEYLWFNGSGAVHKGLDLVLELFARHPELVLHVVGPYQKEQDFAREYRRELTDLPNIRSHGYLLPSSEKFLKIADRVTAFISPSCSEGISTSAITCMQYGMLPILSRNSGITLSDSMGVLLEECSPVALEDALLCVCRKSGGELKEMLRESQRYALETYSMAAFSSAMNGVLSCALAPGGR